MSAVPDFFAFDHRRFATWPEYAEVARAIDGFIRRAEAEGVEVTQFEVEGVAATLARHLIASDACQRCFEEGRREPRSWPPVANVDEGGSVRAVDADVLADRPRWQTDEFLPKLPTIRWRRLDDLREQHLAHVEDLRAAVAVDDQAIEQAIVGQLGDLAVVACRELWQHFPGEGEDAFRLAAAAVEPKSAIPDGSVPIAPTAATADEDRRTVVDVVNSRAEEFDQSYRDEVDALADARRAFDEETKTWRALYRRLEPVYLVRDGAVPVDVREVERHRGALPEDARD